MKAQEWLQIPNGERPPPEPPPKPTIYKSQEWQCHNTTISFFSLIRLELNFFPSLNHGLARLDCRSVLEVSLPVPVWVQNPPPFRHNKHQVVIKF